MVVVVVVGGVIGMTLTVQNPAMHVEFELQSVDDLHTPPGATTQTFLVLSQILPDTQSLFATHCLPTVPALVTLWITTAISMNRRIRNIIPARKMASVPSDINSDDFTMWHQPDELDDLFGIKCAIVRILMVRGYQLYQYEYNLLPRSISNPFTLDTSDTLDADRSEYCAMAYETYYERKRIFKTNKEFIEQRDNYPSDNAVIDFVYSRNNGSIMVRYLISVDGSIKTKPVTSLVKDIKRRGANCPDVLVVTNGELSESHKTSIKEVCKQFKVKCEIYTEAELIIMANGHALQPNMFSVSNDKKLDIIKAAGVKQMHMPRILSTDPVVVLNEWPRETMIKSIRYNDPYSTCMDISMYGRIVN